MPPYEINGNQPMIVDNTSARLHRRRLPRSAENAALAGQVYNPIIGFATVRNVKGGGRESIRAIRPMTDSVRVAAAWTSKFTTAS